MKSVTMLTIALVTLTGELAFAAPAVRPVDPKSLVKTYMDQLRNGTGVESRPLYSAPSGPMIAALKPYLTSRSVDEKSHALQLIGVIGLQTRDRAIRADVIEVTVEFASRRDEASLANHALGRLRQFAKDDFSAKSHDMIEKLVKADDPAGEAVILAGVAGMESVKDELLKLATSDTGGRHFLAEPNWSANLALARMGDNEAARRCVEKLEAEKDIVQRTRGFPDLAFTRHEIAVKYLQTFLMSEERLPSVRTVTEPGTKIASYALDALAHIVDGFPIKSEGPSYTQAQIDVARKWVKEQKSLTFRP